MTERDAAWFNAMAEAMKVREKALAYIESWTLKLAQAESTIAILASLDKAPVVEETPAAEAQE